MRDLLKDEYLGADGLIHCRRCDGARQMQADVVRDCVGLINLDGFHGDRAVISSAGGYRLIFRRRCLCFPPMLEQAYRIEIDGLRGGHSGDEIHKERANAIKDLKAF